MTDETSKTKYDSSRHAELRRSQVVAQQADTTGDGTHPTRAFLSLQR